MVKEDISYNELCQAITKGKVIENYPNHEKAHVAFYAAKPKVVDIYI